MSTNAGATEPSLDAVVSSEPPSNTHIDSSNQVRVVGGADSLDSKTQTLTTEPSVPPAASEEVNIGADIVAQGSVDDARVSGDEVGVVMDKDEKFLGGSSSDVVVSSVPPAASDGVEIEIGVDLLESKSGTLIMEASDYDGGGNIVAQGLIDDARVSVDETGTLMNNSELVLDRLISEAVVSSELLSNEEGVIMENIEKVSEENEENEAEYKVVQDSVNDTRVSVDETGIEMNTSEPGLDKSISDAVLSSEPLTTESDSSGSKTETLTLEPSADHNGDGDNVIQDSVDDSSVPKDEKGVVMENIEKVSDENEENEAEYKVVQDSVNGTNSVDETGTVMNNSELVLDKSISDAVVSSEPPSNRDIDTVNEVKIGADSLGSKTETQTPNPSADHNGDGDIVVQDSIDDSSVSKDEKEVVMENIEKVSDEKEVNIEEKEGEYKVTDIVWAKVKDYPWWPGQILDPSSSTDKAKKYSNKKGLLVGYFGDQSFAWNKPSNIKPFRKNFCKLVKQSNSKPFFHAVNCALDEVSRRVDFGLVCSCLSKEVYDKIKSQDFVNAGITKEACKIDGGDRFSTVSIFKPVKVVQSVQELAKEQFDGFSRLEVLSVRTQLLAFFRWKGHYQFQTHDILDGLDDKLEDESEVPLTEENKVVEDEKPASVGKKVKSKKRKPDVSDSDDSEDSVPCKKERSLTNVTPKGNSSVKRSIKGIRKKATSEDSVIKEENGNEKPASVGIKVKSKKREPDVCDSDDSDDSEDSVPRKKERSLTNVTPKGNTSVKRSKQSTSKKATVEDNGNEKPVSGGKKLSSKNRKPDVSDSDDSEDSVPCKKERSLTNVTPKGNSSIKGSKQCISKKATVEDNGNEKPVSGGKKVSSKNRRPDVSDSDSDDSVPRKKERSLTNVTSKGNSSVKRSKQSISKKAIVEDKGNEKPVSGGKKVSSKKKKADVSDSDSDDSDNSFPRKKEKSLANVTSKGNSSVKRSKQSISKKATVKDNGNEKTVSGGKKVSSKKRKPDVSDSDSDDSVPRKKERSSTNVTSKDKLSVKRGKQSISKKATVEDKGNAKTVSGGKKVSSKERKPDVSDSDSDDSVPHKKERSSKNVTSKVNPSVKRSKRSISKKATVEDNVSKEENQNGTDDKKSTSSSKKLFRVGDRICRIAKQISESPSTLKKESQKSKNDDDESC